jgi:hypothetical protein
VTVGWKPWKGRPRMMVVAKPMTVGAKPSPVYMRRIDSVSICKQTCVANQHIIACARLPAWTVRGGVGRANGSQ